MQGIKGQPQILSYTPIVYQRTFINVHAVFQLDEKWFVPL